MRPYIPPPQPKHKFCNSIGCPDNYTPVDEAWNVKCEDDWCTEEECCLAMCACFPCPNGQIPIESVKYDLCYDNYCSEKQCCYEREFVIKKESLRMYSGSMLSLHCM